MSLLKNSERRASYSQICLDVAGRRFNIGSNICAIVDDNFITDIEGQNIIIFEESIDGFDIFIEKVGRPWWTHTIDRTIERES